MKHKLFALLLMLTCSVQADETNLRNGIQAYRAEHYDTATQHFTAAVFAWWATRGRRGEGVHEAA